MPRRASPDALGESNEELERAIAERTAALRESERRLSVELASVRTLHALSMRLSTESSSESLYGQIVDAAIELMNADAASVQMLAADGQTLTLLASKNFEADAAAFWQRVAIGSASVCGRALRDGARVLVPDVEDCPELRGTEDLQAYRRCGIRSVQSTPLRSRSGELVGMLSTHCRTPHTPSDDEFTAFDVLARQAADLIERALAHDKVRDSEERLRLIMKTAPVTIWMTDADGQVTYLNDNYLDFTGLTVAAALGDGWMQAPPKADAERYRDAYIEASKQRRRFHMEQQLRRHDGEYRWVLTSGVPNHHSDGSFAGYVGTTIDITERKQAEEALSSINQRLILAQEQERARIAQELHDDINQRLAVIGWRLHGLVQDDSPIEEIKQKIADTQEQVSSLVRDAQAMSYRLHPARLQHVGLEAAAAGLCREVSTRQHVPVRFKAENVPEDCAQGISTCVYRVLQEALQNAIKHSGAPAIDVALRGTDVCLELTVRDSGKGFDPADATWKRGLGLSSMNERLKGVGGVLAVDTLPKRGTTVRARVPLGVK